MTTNHERAIEVMRNFWHDGRYAVGFDEIADALADAGLLAPDLPEPDGEWIDADELRELIGRWDVLLADDDHEDMHGMLDDLRALFPAPQTRPEDVPEGEAWIVECYGDRHVGTRDSQESPHWALARMDGTDVTFAGDHLVTLVSRLVPEVEA